MSIYQPSDDSFLLAEHISPYVFSKKVLDICTGSGILAKKAKQEGASSVFAVDINKECAKEFKNSKIKFIHSDLFSSPSLKAKKFDVILCNPPYLPEDKREDKESQLATTGGKRGDEFLLRFFKQAKSHLNKNGVILFVCSSLTPLNRINSLLKKQKAKLKKIAEHSFFMEKLLVFEVRY